MAGRKYNESPYVNYELIETEEFLTFAEGQHYTPEAIGRLLIDSEIQPLWWDDKVLRQKARDEKQSAIRRLRGLVALYEEYKAQIAQLESK